MAILTAILTHLDALEVHRQLDYHRKTAPDSNVAVCYGGSREEFERLGTTDALFVDDPTVRLPHHDRSYVDLLGQLYRERVHEDASVDLVYLIEFDQVVLSPDYERRLGELAGASGAGLFEKSAGL